MGLHRHLFVKTGNVARVDIEIDIGVARANQITNTVMIPGMTMRGADEPGTILRPTAAESGQRRWNKTIALAGAFTMQK